jgi:hypothetical protein
MINVDAALFASSETQRAWELVLSSEIIKVTVIACRVSLPNAQIPELAEALAICGPLFFAHEEDNITLATDCLSVVQRVRSSSMDRSVCVPVIEDIKSVVATFNLCSLITHISRT